MTHYEPASTVLPGLTDEALCAGRIYQGEAVTALLSVPAAYRQPVETEVKARSTRTYYMDTSGGLMATTEQIRDLDEVRREVVTEVLVQLNKGILS